MTTPISTLLEKFKQRSGIAVSITAAEVVDTANVHIADLLPKGRTNDAKAVSFRRSTLTISCLNAPVSMWIDSQKTELIHMINQSMHCQHIENIHVKIVSAFPQRDPTV